MLLVSSGTYLSQARDVINQCLCVATKVWIFGKLRSPLMLIVVELSMFAPDDRLLGRRNPYLGRCRC